MITSEMEIYVERMLQELPIKAIREGQLDKKFVEVIVRQADGKIAKIVKCTLEETGNQNLLSGVLRQVPAMGGLGTVSSLANNVQTEMVRREVKKVGKDVKEVLRLTQDMSASIDHIAQGMTVVQSLSFLNVALSAANLGVSVVGFMTVNRKLDELKCEIDEILHSVKNLEQQKEIEYVNEGRSLLSKTGVLFDHIRAKNCTLTEYEQLLQEYEKYLGILHDLIVQSSIEFELGYKIVMKLLPLYAEILRRYTVESYYSSQAIPSLYQTGSRLIQSFIEPSFMERFFDHTYLDCGVSKMLTEQAQLFHTALIGNTYAPLADTKTLILQLPEKQDYIELQNFITNDAENRAHLALEHMHIDPVALV